RTPLFAMLTWLNGAGDPAVARAAERGGRERIHPAIRDVDGLVGVLVLRSDDDRIVVVGTATARETHDEVHARMARTELLPGEDPALAAALNRAADLLAESCDLDRLLDLARAAPVLPAPPPEPSIPGAGPRPVIAVARDSAFAFVYPELGEVLAAAGADVAFFSPLDDQDLPAGTAGVILSGGYPELYAERLSQNGALRAALRAAHGRDLPIYAECGGLMYLTEAIIDGAGRRWPMVGLLPGWSRMAGRVALGYRTVSGAGDGGLLPAGATMRGHEFHYSRWEGRPADLPPAYRVLPPDAQPYAEGARLGRLTASYVHLPWFAQPELAARFVALCRAKNL
ncbi:MAG TPA: hypothetical protein VD886_10505, partial [Herpetosiphonaceae bacterium]|nr:hypothetical protein [Herpetosiphonaceae bacterium]